VVKELLKAVIRNVSKHFAQTVTAQIISNQS